MGFEFLRTKKNPPTEADGHKQPQRPKDSGRKRKASHRNHDKRNTPDGNTPTGTKPTDNGDRGDTGNGNTPAAKPARKTDGDGNANDNSENRKPARRHNDTDDAQTRPPENKRPDEKARRGTARTTSDGKPEQQQHNGQTRQPPQAAAKTQRADTANTPEEASKRNTSPSEATGTHGHCLHARDTKPRRRPRFSAASSSA